MAVDWSKFVTRLADVVGRVVERLFIPLDQRLMRRNRNLETIPWRQDRQGGKISYGEWAWVIGLMQSLIATHMPTPSDNIVRPISILDVGCGTGLVGLAALPLLGSTGRCLGLDVVEENIQFARAQHDDPRLVFEWLEVPNAAYAPDLPNAQIVWPVADDSQHLVTALSVWTHLAPEAAAASLHEVRRVLRPGGRAIISFFLADQPDGNHDGSAAALGKVSRYHRTRPVEWIFDQPVSAGWSTPSWTRVPEQAIAVDRETLRDLATLAGLKILTIHDGYWRESPGLYFQDIVIFESH